MAFTTGLFLIDAPASALNNLGSIPGSRADNIVGVKVIRTTSGAYPYVSAQAFRYWLRTTLENGNFDWKAAPIYREAKIAYTDANPIEWWDDDLLGYMRAPSKKTAARQKREADESQRKSTPTSDTITRVSPLRVSTLISLGRVNITDDFGTMSRHEGDPVPHEHQFYRTTLKGLLSLDLHACGTFSYRQKTGFRNLDDTRMEVAESQGLRHIPESKVYQLPFTERLKRIQTLFEGLSQLEGGAKQSIHYTDVSPAFLILAVTKGGNHIFGHLVGENGRGLPQLKLEALQEALSVFQNEILSDVYIGWVRGYMDEERAKFEAALGQDGLLAEWESKIKIAHPRQALQQLITDLGKPENSHWLD